jgi:hypothetical protein
VIKRGEAVRVISKSFIKAFYHQSYIYCSAFYGRTASTLISRLLQLFSRTGDMCLTAIKWQNDTLILTAFESVNSFLLPSLSCRANNRYPLRVGERIHNRQTNPKSGKTAGALHHTDAGYVSPRLIARS